MTRLGQHLPPGKHRINISRDPADGLLLAGQLFRSFQQKAGISGKGLISRRKAPATKPVLSHYSSRKLPELIAALMLYSNNFIANQIFLQIGAKKFGYPATWHKGQQAILDFTKKDPVLNSTAINLVEGSGLSRKNRLTLRAMLRVLELFKPHAQLLPEKNSLLLKSGTLTGVYSYAGYFTANGNLDGFTIILNQDKNNRDKILELLEETYREASSDK
jgi:D-alanyl-D-alanine carboxypeptidase/D-alanyl-D-alanine-endopeptidase (penicillin-binding protein 4)